MCWRPWLFRSSFFEISARLCFNVMRYIEAFFSVEATSDSDESGFRSGILGIPWESMVVHSGLMIMLSLASRGADRMKDGQGD